MVRLPAATADTPKHGQRSGLRRRRCYDTVYVGCGEAGEKGIKKKRNTWRREG
jgi:hypothetical protein